MKACISPDPLAPLHRAVREALDQYRIHTADEVLARAAFGLAVAHVQRLGDVDARTAVFLLELELGRVG